MEHFLYEFEVPGFTKFRCVIRALRTATPEDSCERDLTVHIYPDGDEIENEGYVSILFDEMDFNEFARTSHISSLQCTFSVVDVEGESRFPRSFGTDFDEQDRQMRVERFIRRSVLLDSREDLLPGDKLTLRCEGVCFYDNSPDREAFFEKQRMHSTALEESWFIDESSLVGGGWLLDLSRPDTPLCSSLRDKSEYFEALFRWPGKELKDGCMSVPRHECAAFFDMLCYVRFGKALLVWSNRHYLALYSLAVKYGVSELRKKCTSYLGQNLSPSCVIDVLRIADLHHDSGLRAAAFKYTISNWSKMKCDRFKELDRTLLARLNCVAHILDLEAATRDEIIEHRKVAMMSSTWSIFAEELPDLAHVILSMDSRGFTLDSVENEQSESDQEQPLCYDSYR